MLIRVSNLVFFYLVRSGSLHVAERFVVLSFKLQAQIYRMRNELATPCTMTTTKTVRVEFGGGLELLFSNKKSYKVDIPAATVDDRPTDLNYLIHWLKDNLLNEREELFLDKGTVWDLRVSCFHCALTMHSRRPGILVLINDTDWELEGEGGYIVKDNDEIVFISTLHGG